MPLCVCIGLATGKPAVCFVGDGGSLFSIHSLWTAAKFAIPPIFICFVNHEYRLLKDLWCNAMGTTIETTRFVGMDFDNPNLDMQGIAAGFGARIEKIDQAGTIREVLARAQAHRGPSFLIIDREPAWDVRFGSKADIRQQLRAILSVAEFVVQPNAHDVVGCCPRYRFIRSDSSSQLARR
jgi:thiamine pyrophosphate-dependent acetolactate synthase large subunit-like protein